MSVTWFLVVSLLLAILYPFAFNAFNYLWKRRYLYVYSWKVPGPLSLPFLGSFFSFTNPHGIFKRFINLAQTYNGQIFRVWAVSDIFFVISNPEDVDTVANNLDCLYKGEMYDLLTPLLGEGLVSSSGEIWKRHKKLLLPIFNKKNLESFVQTFGLNANKLVIRLKEYAKNGKMVPVQLLYCNTLDTACATLIGVDIENMNWEDKFKFGKSVKCGLTIQFMRQFSAIYRWDCIFNRTGGPKMLKECSKNVFEFVDKLVKEKQAHMDVEGVNEGKDLEKEPRRTTLFDYLPKGKHEENTFLTMKELRDEVATFLVSASDTTTITECFLLTALGCYPDIQKKVYDEVMDVVGPVRDVEYTDLPELRYTEMVIKETLRYFNPVSFVFKKANKDMALGSTFIPKESYFCIPMCAIHRNPKFWPNPSQFDPERFNSENDREPHTFIPFSAGLRICPGDKFAMMLIKTVIAIIVRRFKVSTDYKSLDEIEFSYDFTTSARHGYKLRIHERASVD